MSTADAERAALPPSPWTPERWQAISRHLDEALDLSEEERRVWLASLGARDPALAADVAALLAEHGALQHEAFLERAPVRPAPLVHPGQTLGAYTLQALIGEGGMGSVWLAERSDGRFERRAAVKFLSAALAGRGEARFRREGRILARLTHPHIAQLFDAGVTADGHPYLILEYVDGQHIDRSCDDRALTVHDRIRLVLDVIAAIAHAHAHLVVHRDIKPSNVIVGTDGHVKLLDFGVATLFDGVPGTAPTLLTREGGGAFTPEFAAPEQLTGEPVTTAVDVYALGVLLYVLLTGHHPAGPALGSAATLVRAITEVDPPRPSVAVSSARTDAASSAANAARRATTPDRLEHALQGDLDTIVCKALKKRPEERYPSVTALADDLRRYLENQPIAARPDTLVYRARKFVRRNKAAVVLSTLAVLAIVGGTTGTLLQARTVRVERDFALNELSRAEAVNDFDSFILSEAAPSGKPFTVADLLARAERIVERQTVDEPGRVELLISIGRHYFGLDQDARSTRVLEDAYRRSRGLSDASIRARASCALAATLARGTGLRRADELIREGLAELPGGPQFTIDRAWCLLRGAEVSREGGRATEAVARDLEAQSLVNGSRLQSDILRLRASIDLAESYRVAGRSREASTAFGQASTLLAALGRDNTDMAATILNNWGLTLEQLGRPREAERAFRRAIAISSAGDAEQTVSPMLLVNQARALRDLGRLPEAADDAERGYARARQAGDNVIVNQSLLLRASIYRMQGRLPEASAALAEVEPRLRRSLPPGHVGIAALLMQRASLEGAQGITQHALEMADQAVAIAEASKKVGGPGSVYVPLFLVARADVERQLGRSSQATADATRAVGLFQTSAGSDRSSLVGLAYLALGHALAEQGQRDRAIAAFRSAFSQLHPTLGDDHPDTRAARELAGLPPGN